MLPRRGDADGANEGEQEERVMGRCQICGRWRWRLRRGAHDVARGQDLDVCGDCAAGLGVVEDQAKPEIERATE